MKTILYMTDDPIRGKVSGRVWDDANGDGIRQAGEAGLAGVTVRLFSRVGGAPVVVTTAADGTYQFDEVLAGLYYIEVSLPPGKAFSAKNATPDPTIDSDISTRPRVNKSSRWSGASRIAAFTKSSAARL